MNLRYRILSSRFDLQSILEEARARSRVNEEARQTLAEHHPVIASVFRRPGHGDWGDGTQSTVDGIVGMPREVELEEEGEAPRAVLLAMLKSGQLKETDLVDDGSGWTVAKESPALFEYFAAQEADGERLRGLLPVAVLAVLGIAALLWLFT